MLRMSQRNHLVPLTPFFNPGDRNNRLAILEGIARASWHFGLMVVTVCPEATYRDSNHAERRAAGAGSRVRAGSQQRRRPGDRQCRPGAAPSSGPVARRTIDVQGGTDFTIAP